MRQSQNKYHQEDNDGTDQIKRSHNSVFICKSGSFYHNSILTINKSEIFLISDFRFLIYYITMSITQNIQSILSGLNDNVTLVVVTKNRTAPEILEVIEAGITDIGENRLRKLPELPENITKHFIGRLQSNKVRDVVRLFDVIQSVDSLKLAHKIDKECEKIGKTMPILIQVNTSDEPQKGGVPIGDADNLIKEASKLKNIQIQGLMTLAVHSADGNEVQGCFKKLKQLFEQIKNSNLEFRTSSFEFLSMGMSEDYRIAAEEGATMIRLGRGVFGD